MDTLSINKEMMKIASFKGTFCRNELPNINSRPFLIIANTDPCHKPGEHWVAMIFNNDGTGEYFDSFGLPPLHPDLWNYMESKCTSGWTFNQFTFQSYNSQTCGQWCVSYLKFRCKGYGYLQFVNLFTKNAIKNEKILKNL